MKKLLLFFVFVQLSILSYGYPIAYNFFDIAAYVFTSNDSNINPEDWKTFYSDERVGIQYKYSECDDKKNDKYFSYYLIKLKNKTNKTIRVEYILGEKEDDLEQSKNVVLRPNEEITGACDSSNHELKFFVSDLKNNPSTEKRPFMISKIDSYEL